MPISYSPETIAGFLLQEKLAIHGVSPQIYGQNQGLVHELGRAAAASSNALIGVQIIGSRGNGTSGLYSDLDLVSVAFDTDEARLDRERLVNAAEDFGVETDDAMAALAIGIHDAIPVAGASFIAWTDARIGRAASLFEGGIFASPDQQLGQLAVTSILQTYGNQHDIAKEWEEIRQWHARSYLGNPDRMRAKLIERLGGEQSGAVHRALSDTLIQRRQAKFALPQNIQAHHKRLQTWANDNRRTLQRRQGWRLYQEVLREL